MAAAVPAAAILSMLPPLAVEASSTPTLLGTVLPSSNP
jgi:hypothetical protein